MVMHHGSGAGIRFSQDPTETVDVLELADETTVAALPEVTEVRRVYGVPDYIVVMVDVADGNEYERFQTQKMTKLPGIRHIISHPMMKLIKGSD
jgi:DNA-binding Lrp family transcriptional regulator